MIPNALRVVDAGWGSTIQDLGRHGMAHLGVPAAGAVDRHSQSLVNRLVGNSANAATFETRQGLVIEAIEPLVVATSEHGSRQILQPGEQLSVDAPAGSMWAYLSVRGGIEVDAVLGSRSHDTLSGIGPPPISAGMTFDVGVDPRTDLVADHAPTRPNERVIRLWSAPRSDWFVGGLAAVTTCGWAVSGDVDRVGVRLAAGRFDRTPVASDQMASEGLIEGAMQITPAGEPIVMLANHPTTGGYPVIGVVDPSDVAIVAQAPPGSTLRFRPIGS